jgi:hypothetical protein
METKMNSNDLERNNNETEKSQRVSRWAKSTEEMKVNLIQPSSYSSSTKEKKLKQKMEDLENLEKMIKMECNELKEKTQRLEENVKEENNDYAFYVKCLGVIIITIFCVPFLICNIYYVNVENSCSIIKPHSLKISLKEYLVVATILDGIIYVGAIISMLMLNPDIQNKTYKIIYYLLTPFRVFSIVWDILGAIVFWGYIVNKNECSYGLSEYLYVIFILKIVNALTEFRNKKRK